MLLERTANHGRVRKRRESYCLDIDSKIRGVDPTWAITHSVEEPRDDRSRERGVILGPTGHRIDVPIEELELDVAELREPDVVGVRVAMMSPTPRNHVSAYRDRRRAGTTS